MGKLCSALILSCGIFLISSLFLKVPTAHAATELFSSSFYSDSSLVSYYRLEGNSTDSKGSNNGTDTGMSGAYVTSSGEFGDGADFSGSNYITLGNVGSLSFTGPQAFSVSFWVNFTTNSNLVIVGKNSTLNHTAKGWSVMVAGGMLYLQINGGTSSGANELQVNSGNFSPHYNDGQFHFATVTYDGSETAAGILLYMDGVLQPTAGYNIDFNNLSASAANSVDAAIGAVSGGGFNFVGSVDDLAIFSRVLSGSEVRVLYGSFYSQINNTDNGRWLLRSTPATSTDANFIKRFPEDWIVYVTSTANATTSGGYTWYDVVDPTDGVEGWMAASSSVATYLQLSTSTSQSGLEGIASTTATSTSDRADLIGGAIDYYYNNVSTTPGFYSSDDGNNHLSMFKTGVLGTTTYSTFPEQIIMGIAIAENGTAGHNFNNENVSFDYGHGEMQLTPFQVWDHELLGDYADNTENVPANGSFLEIFPCRSFDELASPRVGTSIYINCYTNGGEHNSNPKSYQDYASSSANPQYKWYANTAQSIYANIKDGMRKLQDKYNANVGSPITTSTVVNSTTYTDQEREIIIATEGYNGTDCGYVNTVASTTDMIDQYFPGETTSSIGEILQRMHSAGSEMICASLHSPATLSIEDSNHRTVGIIDGKAENDFPLAVYDPSGKWADILAAADGSYTYKVTGIGKGIYEFDVTIKHGNKNMTFNAKDMPVVPKQVDTYTFNMPTLLEGQNGVTVTTDINGDGIIDRTEELGGLTIINDNENLQPVGMIQKDSAVISPPNLLFDSRINKILLLKAASMDFSRIKISSSTD